MIAKRKSILCLVALGILLFGMPLFAQDDTLRVLFIGNSHTYVNDLPTMFQNLAQSGGHPVIKDMNAPGGYTFQQHASNATTLSKINQGIWDYVVLQEQSQFPVIEYYRDSSMYPSARILDSLIRRNNERTAFYMTWGWRDGGQHTINGHSSPDFRDYYHMQDSVTAAYTRISAELNTQLLPAGNAWKIAKTIDSSLVMWLPDGYHPALIGTYLTACVFYAKFFNESPIGLSYIAGISPETAAFLQTCANQATLSIHNSDVIIPSDFILIRIYPNPFNSNTNIEYSLLQSGKVYIAIYDILGRKIAKLVDKNQIAGKYLISWNADNYPTGIYFLKTSLDDYSQLQKMVVMR